MLAEAGGELSHVVMLRIYIAEAARDQQEWISQVLLQRFPNDPPASSWIIVSGLSLPEWLIEVEADAPALCEQCGAELDVEPELVMIERGAA